MAIGWSPKDYTPFFLTDEPTHTIKEIRAEYSRQRDIAVKRAARFENLGLSEEANYLRNMFPTLKEMQAVIDRTTEENKKLPARKRKKVPTVQDYLARGKATLNERSSSISGMRKIQGSILQISGEVVPLGEILEFDDFMKSWRLSAYSKTLVPSEGAVQILESEDYQALGGSFSTFYSLFREGASK